MLKTTDNISVSPAARISSLLSVAAIGDASQELDSRAAQFAKGQHNQAFPLGLLQNDAVSLLKNNFTTASVSPAAHLIDQMLKQAEVAGVSTKYEAKTLITRAPTSPEVMAQDLKSAISNTGLFYESHMGDFVEGHRSITEIKQEPQNQFNSAANSLLPQQLNILENQRLSWHGEVWPHQKMDWDIYLQDKKQPNEGNQYNEMDEQAIASDLTLHLPNLGKVTAKLSLVNGRMRISVLAQEMQTLTMLKAESKKLVDAIEKNGQVLEGLHISQRDGRSI